MKDIASVCLDIRELRIAVALAVAGSTAKAALALHLTQPAVSRALLGAEDKLRTKLFDRTPRGLVATPAGAELVAGATRLLADLADLERRVCSPPQRAAPLRVVCQCYTAYHWLPSTLRSLRESFPAFDVDVAVDHTVDPEAALADGSVDVALLTTARAAGAGVRHARLFEDEIVFVLAASHPLAARRALTLADLREQTLLTSRTPPEEAAWFMRNAFGRARPRLRFERLPLTEAIVDFTRAGFGIAVMSEWIASPHLARGDLVAKRLASGPLMRPWRLAWRPDVDDAARRLLAALQATVPRAQRAIWA